MHDAMLSELYQRCLDTKRRVEFLNSSDNGNDTQRAVAIAENKLLSELIGIRTDQIRGGE
jgi:hypothetical protein